MTDKAIGTECKQIIDHVNTTLPERTFYEVRTDTAHPPSFIASSLNAR